MVATRFPLLECVSPPAVAAHTAGTLTYPGYAVWPGGDVVHIGATAYPDGVYAPSDPQVPVLADGAVGNHVDMSPGLLEQPGYTWTTPAPVQGVYGPTYLFQTPMWTPAQVSAGVTFTMRARHVSGYYYESAGPPLTVGVPWQVGLGDPTRLFDPSATWAYAYSPDTSTLLAPGDVELTMLIRPPFTSSTGLAISALNLTADQAALWEIYDLWADLTPLGGSWPLRQRQTLTGTPGWPLRQRQNGAHSGSWPLRQRQSGR